MSELGRPNQDGKMPMWGIIAEFDTPDALLRAAERLRDAGFKRFDCHSPFPIHGMDEAMGLKRSKVSYIAAAGALLGGGGAIALQGWASTIGYPLVISGKPFFSYPAYFPITFALAILLAAFGAFFGFFAVTKVRFHHPLFTSDRFERFSDDGFIISIDAVRGKIDIEAAQNILAEIGAQHIEIVRYGEAQRDA